MMNKTLIILDGNHLAHRAYHKFPNLKTFDGVNTSVVYGIPYIIESLIRKFAPDKAMIALDGGRSSFRKGLLPSYKEREQKLGFDKEDFYRQRDDAVRFLSCLGIDVVHQRGQEADDLITMVALRYYRRGWKVIIISGDKDFNQLIGEHDSGGIISVFNTGKGILIELSNAIEILGYHPNQCVDYLSLIGDHSDNIPGYPGIGEIRGIKFIQQFGSIRKYLKLNQQFGKLDNNKLKEVWQLNTKLIDLKYFYRKFLIKDEVPLKKGVFDEKLLGNLCHEFEMNSFLKPQFINTYKKLYGKGK